MQCRICKTSDVVAVIDLGAQIITSRFPQVGDDSSIPKTHIVLIKCNTCGLVQLKNTVLQSELYEHTYGYRSGINGMMVQHLKDYSLEILSKVNLSAGDAVLDIGSNDATFLSFFNSDIIRVGCDPTAKQFANCYKNIHYVPTYFSKDALKHLNLKYKVVSSISMFYDLPDPVQFAEDVYNILSDDGIWTLEQSYILSMLEKNSIDTICHEHIEYYALKQILHIMKSANLKIIDIKQNECNGGSFRIYVAKNESSYKECSDLIASYIETENVYGLDNLETYHEFVKRCDHELSVLKEFLICKKSEGKQTYIYGASTKGNCLLQYANITSDLVPYAVERNLQKIGCMTSTGIEIIAEETMRKNPPDYLLILPWHFKDSIIQREELFLHSGGYMIFPLPKFEIVHA